MKLKRILIFGTVLVLIATTLLTTLFLTYSPLRYRTKMYSYCNEWLDPTFLENNMITSTRIDNPNSNEDEAQSLENPKYFGPPDGVPSTRTFIITEKETFDEIFTNSPISVNFDKEMIVLYTIGSVYPAGQNYKLEKIEVGGDTATVYFDLDKKPWDNRKNAVLIWQRYMVVKMKKMNISTVEFEMI